MSVGFVQKKKPEPETCQHRDNWDWRVEGDYLFRYCFTCGTTWMLTSIKEGFAWDRIAEPEETRDVAGVGKNVQPVQTAKADRPVQSKSRSPRRPRQSVQDVPPPLQLDAPEESVAEAQCEGAPRSGAAGEEMA